MQRRSLFRVSASLALVGSGFGLAACGGGGGNGLAEPGPAPAPAPAPPPLPVRRTFAYVARYSSAEIEIFQVDAAGVLNPVGSVPTGTSTRPMHVALHPSGGFAYVANNLTVPDSVLVYAVDAATGMLTRLGSFLDGRAAIKICTHPSGNFAYVPMGGLNVVVCAIDATSGALTKLDELSSPGLADITIDASGQFVFMASSNGSVAAYAVQPDGKLSLVNSVALLPSGAGMAPTVCVGPSGNFLYATNGYGVISIHPIDAATGELGDAGPESGDAGYRIAIDPAGGLAYAAYEDAATGHYVRAYRIDATSGGLTAVASKAASRVDALAIHSGIFAYVADATTGKVSTFALDEGGGALTEVGSLTAPGTAPFGITVATLTHPPT